ncbi:hypothetical protein OZ410_10800 [Robiginitalea sp. M366]|uniref:hypothetical protein n=1 Tax=Robiginitalea aestuariiviva TaxID=3036903 RepID=UPI00240E1880|nr:hypothetical protein [Robiginitalea aestuariiviva]MDG1572803.1 hypothetical protein [Robiginitalea aestuariiviva]
MKTPNAFRLVRALLALLLLGTVLSCGPVVFAYRQGPPPPPWFYPHRVEVVRYIYFPGLTLYYDLHTHVYVYLEGSTWVRRERLPERYRHLDLSRERYQRIRDYRGDNIREYHQDVRRNSGRSNRDY